MSVYLGIDGEMRLPARWTNCVICGTRTPQPPVCNDLRCEIKLEEPTVNSTDDYGRHAEAIAEIFAAHPGLEAALNIRHSVVASIAVDLATFGRISDKQIALVLRIAEEASTKRASTRARRTAGRDQHMARIAEAWAAAREVTE